MLNVLPFPLSLSTRHPSNQNVLKVDGVWGERETLFIVPFVLFELSTYPVFRLCHLKVIIKKGIGHFCSVQMFFRVLQSCTQVSSWAQWDGKHCLCSRIQERPDLLASEIPQPWLCLISWPEERSPVSGRTWVLGLCVQAGCHVCSGCVLTWSCMVQAMIYL